MQQCRSERRYQHGRKRVSAPKAALPGPGLTRFAMRNGLGGLWAFIVSECLTKSIHLGKQLEIRVFSENHPQLLAVPMRGRFATNFAQVLSLSGSG